MSRKYFMQDNINKKVYYFEDILLILKTKDIDLILESLEDIQICETAFHVDLLADTEKKDYEVIYFDNQTSLDKAIQKARINKIMSLVNTHPDKNKAGVYKISNKTLEFTYIGSTTNFEKRLEHHRHQKYVGYDRLIHPDTKFEILELNNENEARLQLEEKYILDFVNNNQQKQLLNKHLYPYSGRK